MYQHDQPALCVSWSKDGTKLASGSADKTAKVLDTATGQSQQVAQHDAPIKCVRWVDGPQPVLATGSWDKTVKYWDLRTPNPVATVQLPERCYAMDVNFPLMVVGMAERHIQIFSLQNPGQAFKTLQSPLKYQTRCLSCFTTGNGFAIGSIEGRVGIQYVEDKDTSNNFSFKCHRDNTTNPNVYAVNWLSFHPTYGTFSTAGSDGTFHFWDKDARTRLKSFSNVGGQITTTAFNRTGNIFAYAIGYDWSKGYQSALPTNPNKIMLQAVKDEDVKPRPKKRSLFIVAFFVSANDNKDFEVSEPPSDSTSELSFSPTADLLAASSWDNGVRIWEVQANGQTVPKAMYQHDQPALCVSWSKDGTKLASGSADKTAKVLDTATGQSQQVAQHDAPIKCVRWVDGPQPVLATGSWDKTVKYWDLRTPTPVATVQLPETCYAMDVTFPLMVVATADRHIQIFNLQNPSQPFKSIQSPLKYQTRCVACFPTGNRFVVGSIEGRVGIQYVEDKDASNNYSFRCHRDNSTNPNVYAVNWLSFHPTYGTLATAGSDGTFHFWDLDARTRLKSFPNIGGQITTTAFNRTGNIFAYAVCYDWSKGYQSALPTNPNKIMLQAVKDENVKPRPSKKR